MSEGRAADFWGVPSCRAKKLIARVRPGVEETFASLEPSSLLMSDDLPTLERPRKATSGASPVRVPSGKCSGLVAERRNFGTNCIGLSLPALGRVSQVGTGIVVWRCRRYRNRWQNTRA